MSRKISVGAAIMLMALTAALTLTATMIFSMQAFNLSLSDYARRIAMFRKLSTVDDLVRTQYIGSVNETTLTDNLISGYIAGTGDAHAAYYDAETYSKTMMGMEGKGIGIGVNVIENTDGNIKVVSVLDNSPAKAAGVLAGDLIVQVGSNAVTRLGFENSINLLKGDEGSTVAFTVQRGTQKLPFSVVRKKFDLETVHAHLNGNIAVVRIDEFDENTAAQFNTAVDKMTADGALSFVFDLRNNPGGAVDAAAKMLDKLLPAGPIVRVRYKGQAEKVLYTSDANQVNKPMAVLVNSGTASAAELFTAALRDYHKARIIGEKTYGKGTMQSYFKLSDGSAVKISVAYFDPPTGANFDGKGIEPDIKATLSKQKLDRFYSLTDDEDDQLQAAFEYLRSLSS